MQPIRSIAEIPFHEQPPLELLSLTSRRDSPLLDDTRFGWARVDELWLEDERGAFVVPDALVLAVHAAEEPRALAGDVDLEFFVEEVAKDYSVTVLLSKFLDVWLPRVGAGAEHIVLAMCNPHGATLRQPAAAGATPVLYATGDVDSYLVDDRRVTLKAAAWRAAE